MKNTQILKDLRNKDIKALTKELLEMNSKMAKLRADLAFRKLKNVKQVAATRQYIAQIWTIINEKAVAEIMKNEVTQ